MHTAHLEPKSLSGKGNRTLKWPPHKLDANVVLPRAGQQCLTFMIFSHVCSPLTLFVADINIFCRNCTSFT